jgi:hypothetical protein
MDHPKAIGERSTLAVMLAPFDAGYQILLPFGENTRYDLVIHNGVHFHRVQCKTGRLRKGGVRFRTTSSYADHPNPKITRRDYLGEIDYFAVYCPETGGVYLVPVADVPFRYGGSLRVNEPRNGQKRRIRLAAEFEVRRISIVPPTAEPGASAGGSGSCA